MINTKIKYIIKTDDYTIEGLKPIIDRVKTGIFDGMRREHDGRVSTSEIEYLYRDLEIMEISGNRLTTRPQGWSDEHGHDHGLDNWRAFWIMFEDGTEFFDPVKNYDDFLSYIKEGIADNYIDLDDIIM